MGRCILLVEDNRDDEELTLRALHKNGITDEVIVARDGVQALDYLFARGLWAGRDASDLPRVVLLDLKLPKIDGMGVLEQLRADPRTKLIPVVVLTSSKEDSDVNRCYLLGANSYVRKPVDFDTFTEAVKTLGLFWLRLNELPPSWS
jgi:two-component system response regulator